MTGRFTTSLQRVPPEVLKHLGEQLEIPIPHIATLRSLYRSRRTRFEHQRLALELSGFSPLSQGAERNLISHLRHEAESVLTIDSLVESAKVWLYEHRYVIVRNRDLRRLALTARGFAEKKLCDEIEKAVGDTQRRAWVSSLLAPSERRGLSVHEWLRQPPHDRTTSALSEQLRKRQCLIDLGADRLALPNVSLARLTTYGRRVTGRRPSRIAAVDRTRQTVELACSLRHTLLIVTDQCLNLADRVTLDLRRIARDRVVDKEPARRADRFRVLVDAYGVLADTSISADDARTRALELLEPLAEAPTESRAAAERAELTQMTAPLREVMGGLSTVPFIASDDHPIRSALPILRELYSRRSSELPGDVPVPFAPCWLRLIQQRDRAAALRGYEAATLMALHRGLRNGSVHVADAFKFTNPDASLIPAQVWAKHRARHFRRLGVPESAKAYLGQYTRALAANLTLLEQAIADKAISVHDGRVRTPRHHPFPRPENLTSMRRRLFTALVSVQLPDVLLEVDSEARFSWELLGRVPHHDAELVTIYGAVLAHGSDLTSAEVSRMVPGLNAEAVGIFMRRLEDEETLRRANEAILKFLRSHNLARLWGDGVSASADMMSLDATRRLWMTRMEPRRRSFAVGTYSHVLNDWSVVYDQPIVLNKRQAGAAIEGALRQRVAEIDRVAVDTHGFTHPAMAVAKLVGLDLCPRLAHLADRKLYLPRGLAVPSALRPLARQSVSVRTIQRGWDELVRIAASIEGGWCSATLALERLGSAAIGHPVYEAANALGKLQRTLFLCDYWGNAAFRRQILDLLNQGEAVHSLQRAIHRGLITAKRGRKPEEHGAISGSLALLANIVMAFNTARMQSIVDLRPDEYDLRALSHVAPIAFEHINLRGTFRFDIEPYREQLLLGERRSPRRAASS